MSCTNPVRRVLIIKPSSLGDVVHTLPAVHLLKETHPNWKISWLVNTEWAPLLEGNPDLETLIPFPRNSFRGLRGLMNLRHWLANLEIEPPDLVLDFQGLTRSALLAKWSRPGRILCLGNAEIVPRWLADAVIPVDRGEHAVDRYLRMAAALGAKGRVEFPLPEGTRPAGFQLDGKFLLVHPFSRGEGKSLEAGLLEKLCSDLAPMPIVIAGKAEAGFRAPGHCLNLLNRTSLGELIWLIRRAAFTLSVDSGPMHIAAAITPRLLAIHTWSDPRVVGPYAPEAWVWKNGVLSQVRDLSPNDGAMPLQEEHLPGLVDFLKNNFSA